MPGSKYERELRFIDSETRRLGMHLEELRETMPADPMEATRKAQEVLVTEEKIADLLSRRRQIEDSFIAAGMDIPDVGSDLNANVHLEGGRTFNGGLEKPQEPAQVMPEATMEDLTQEIESVTDELMGLEIKMLRADMNGEEDEKQKLSMMASSLRSRRDTLVERVKEMKAEEEAAEKAKASQPADTAELEARISSLEADNRALRTQVADVRMDVSDIKESLRQIMNALGIND